MQGGRTLWERDETRREGACEVEGKRDATWEASVTAVLGGLDAPLSRSSR